MTMFLGKISTERKTAPKKISNALPKGIICQDGKYYKENSQEKIPLKKNEEKFNEFFGLKNATK